MRPVTLYMQMSLDGIVSDVDQWMSLSDEIVEDAVEYYRSLDTIIFGGRTYPSMADYWQRAETSSDSPLERAFAQRINDIGKIVISRSRIDLTWRNSRQWLLEDEQSLAHEIEKLKQGGSGRISVESGTKTWQLFVKHGLFDELWLQVHPVVVGRGEKLFADAETQYPLQLRNSKVYRNGVIGLHYVRTDRA